MQVLVLGVLLLIFSSTACGSSDVLRRTQPLYGISTFVEKSENYTLCYRQLISFRKAVDEGKVWAIKTMDASGRPGSGFIYGNNFWIGSHAHCKDISNTKPLEVNSAKISHLNTFYDYPPYPMGFTVIQLKHNSTVQFDTRQPLQWTIQLGLCLPMSCTKDEILGLSEMYFSNNVLQAQKLYNLSLEVTEARKLSDDVLWIFKLPKTIIFSVILVIILFLTIAGTICDVRRHNLEKNILTGHNVSCKGKSGSLATIELVSKSSSAELSKQSKLTEILRCFSFFSNTKKLVKTKLSTESIGCIHGLRFISMIWVVALHGIFYQTDYMKNAAFGYRLSEDIFAEVFSNGTYAVDSYLFLSGFLVSYLYYYKQREQHEQPEESVKYLAKIREFIMLWINRFCRKEMCMTWSWYLSLDMQFFTITTFLLILSTIASKVSAIAVVMLILTAIVTTSYKSYSIGYIPTMDEQLAQLDALYDLPWSRIGPYLIGVITAYILVMKLQKKLILTKKMKILAWTLFPLLNLWIMFTLHTRKLSVEFSAIYMGISRTLWGVGLAWILIACCTGNARTLNKLLSFKGFIPLSRLTYCVYLLNPVVANMIYLSSEFAFEVSLAEFAVAVCGITLISFYMAYLFSVIIESPFILLTKMAFRRTEAKLPKSQSK